MNEKLRILILEDVEADADIIQWELKKAGILFEVITANNRITFENALNELQPDIVLSDHSLPYFNSLEALQMVRDRHHQIPFILITGTVSEEFAVEIMRSGADDYILKDRLQRLPSAVRNALEKYRLSNEKLVAIEKITESDANLHATINNTKDCIFSVDRNYKLLSFNKVFSEIVFAVTRESIKEGDAFFNEASNADIIIEWEQNIKRGLSGEQFVKDTSYSFGEQTLFFEISINPIRKEDEVIGVGCFSRDITSRKETEEKLKESEQRFRSLVEHNYDGIILRDEHFSVFYRSPSAVRILGWSDEDDTPDPVKFAHPEDAEKVKHAMHDLLHKKSMSVSFTYRTKHKDGHYIWLEGKMTNMLDDKSVNAYVSNFRDITEQKEAKEKLIESELKFRALMENNYDGITLRDESLNIIYRNPAAIRMLGWTAEDNHTQSLLVNSHPDDIGAINSTVEAVLNSIGKPVQMAFRSKHKDGHYIWLEGVMTNMLHDKNVKAFVTNFRDITERMESQKALQESEERYRQIVETAQEGIWVVDELNITSFVNDKLCHMLGYACEEIIGKPAVDFMGVESNELISSSIRKWKQGQLSDYEFLHISKSGKKTWLCINANPILSKDGKYKGTLAMVSDITLRKETDEELKKTLNDFDMLISNIKEGFFSIEVSDTFKSLIISNAFAEIYGYPAQDFFDNPNLWFENIQEDDKIKMKESMQLLYSGKKISDEHRIIRSDKRMIWVSGNVTPTLNERGKLIRLDGVISDITARKTAEDEIRKREAELIEAQKVAKYGNWNMDNLSNKLTWSEELYNVFGTDRTEFSEKYHSFIDMIDEVDAERIRAITTDSRKTGQPFILEYHITTKRGEKRVIQDTGKAELDSNGNVIRLYGTAQDITERKKAETELNELNEQLRKLSAHLQTIREEERTSIAREVHDELGQQMTSLKMDIAALKDKYEKELPDIGIKTQSMLEMVNEAIRTVRKIVIALRPGILDDLGLEAAIEWQAKDFQQRTGIECILKSSIQSEKFSPEINITVFRIFQESLTNVMRHAHATEVRVNLYEEHTMLLLEIKDNGIGISDERKYNKTSFGLLGMKERASMIKGNLDVIQLPERGTKINLKIPL